jgi:cellulose synthase/poly-beta-1,6-N-acetylglucosamine synthase-like glycosyltransferase
MNTLLQSVFWGALTLLLYSYVIYPFLIIWVARFKNSNSETSFVPTVSESIAQLPTVAVIVAAFNEETHIVARIKNLLSQNYPSDRFQIFVGCDGCADRTVELARSIFDSRVLVCEFKVNRGKASVLNDLVAQASAEVLIFTDANTVFKTDTVKELVVALDDSTAATCGELMLQAPDSGGNQDHQYWSFERKLKAAESSIGGLLGANGGVYAIRKNCFIPLRTDTICDDFVIAMNIAVKGQGLKYVSSAIAYEDTPGDVMTEYHRRVRIGIGNYQALFRHPRYLFGGNLALGFTYFSHKVLRWLTPHLLLVVLVSSLFLADHPMYLAIAILQLAGYAVAMLVFVTRDRFEWPGLIKSALFFAVLNVAFLVGFKRFITSDYRGSWRRTERTDSPQR